MSKYIYLPVILLIVLSGFIFSIRVTNDELNPSSKSSAMADSKNMMDERRRWDASPDGILYKNWQASPAGKKVQASYDKIKKEINSFSNMEAIVTSTTFQRTNASASGPKWILVSINGETYMMQFVPKEFEQLVSLQVNDKIIIKSRSAGLSPNHPHLILSGDYIEHNKKVLFKRDLSKNNRC